MKIGIVGVGSVGGAIASAIVSQEIIGELVLFDTDNARLHSAEMDLSHAAAFGRGVVVKAGKYSDMKDADIIVIAAGANQKIGESRRDLVEKNRAVFGDVIPKIMKVVDRKKVILVIVTNPLDSMVMTAQKLSDLPANRVIGTGTTLDSARFRAELSCHFKVSPESITAWVLGEHGDSSVMNWTSVAIGGAKVSVPPKSKAEMESKIHGAAYEIIQGRGATWDGIAAATTDIIRAIVNDEHRVMPVSIVSNKVAYGMPRIVGANGVVSDFTPLLSATERRALNASIKTISKT